MSFQPTQRLQGFLKDSDVVPNDQTIVGQTVRSFRLARKWRQEDLAFHSGFDRTQIVRMEAGEFDMRLSTLRKLSRALGVTPAALLKNLPKD